MPKPSTYSFFVQADEIGRAHQWGRAWFGKGISFKTREMNSMERQIYKVHQVHQWNELITDIET